MLSAAPHNDTVSSDFSGKDRTALGTVQLIAESAGILMLSFRAFSFYPVLCTLSPDGCTAHVPDFPKIEVQTPTLDAALLEVKQQIEKALRQYKNPPIPTKQEQIVVPNNSVLVLVKAG